MNHYRKVHPRDDDRSIDFLCLAIEATVSLCDHKIIFSERGRARVMIIDCIYIVYIYAYICTGCFF